jgi:hypothetical protein
MKPKLLICAKNRFFRILFLDDTSLWVTELHHAFFHVGVAEFKLILNLTVSHLFVIVEQAADGALVERQVEQVSFLQVRGLNHD